MNQMNQIGCVALTILGIILLVSPDLILSKNTDNAYLKNIYNNNKIFGSCLLVGAFYLYTIEYNQGQLQSVPLSSQSVPLSSPSVPLSVPLSSPSVPSVPLSSSSSAISSELISNLS